MKRAFDLVFASLALILVLPILIPAAVGVKLSSAGPVLFRARRAGLNGIPFEMLKLRTMHEGHMGAAITAQQDARVFWLGRILRALKIDELPQFLNVVRGDMSVVGPRPEDPRLVEQHYAPWMHETLNVRPGLTSPGAIFYYAFGDRLIDNADPEGSYVAHMLTPKLAIERAYLDRAGVVSDLGVILRTICAILGQVVRHPVGPPARDRAAAEAWCPAGSWPDTPDS